MITKVSYGVICCRYTPKGVQILMVKKATTYHFCEFVSGKYKRNQVDHIKKLLSNMTYHEKMDILSLDFDVMWYRIYREHPTKRILGQKDWYPSFLSKKTRFENTFVADKGVLLKKLIKFVGNVDPPWEFPKGRKSSISEYDLDTAIREFEEETNTQSSQYQICANINPYIESYTDFGVTYRNIYYFAESIGDWEPSYSFGNPHQSSEVSDIKWVGLADIHLLNLTNIVQKRMTKSFKKIIKKFKNAQKKKRQIM